MCRRMVSLADLVEHSDLRTRGVALFPSGLLLPEAALRPRLTTGDHAPRGQAFWVLRCIAYMTRAVDVDIIIFRPTK
jgi:hypothetical protein